MLRVPLKSGVTRIITPLARLMVSIGMTANVITVVGAMGSWGSSLYFFTRGEFFIGTLVIAFFLLSDLFDGTIARMTNSSGSRFGALLDSTLDRVSDAVIIIALLVWSVDREPSWLLPLYLALLTGFLISYIKARAEALDLKCEVGIAERAERLIILLTSTGLYGLGFDSAMIIGLWFLVVINLATVFQRFRVVYIQS
jgi:CDP-diacylglycerol--glycerol-3-phosphate 3-phosphatidyltransferase